MSDPLRDVEDVRGRVVSLSGGREHHRQEVWRGGAVDRGSARTALDPTRERTVPSLWTRTGRAFGQPFGGSRDGRGHTEAGGSPSSEAPPGWLIRQAGWQVSQDRSPPATAQGEPVSMNEQRASVAPRRRDRESSDPQGARDGSRLQKSVRRIFPVANAGHLPATVGGAREPGVARGDPPAFDEAGRGSRRAIGCGARQRE